MSVFRYGFLCGSGPNTEFQLWNDNKDTYSGGIETGDIDSLIGTQGTDFRSAPYFCRQGTEEFGFVICGFNKDEVEKLANMFIDFLHEANPEFLKVPPMVKERNNE